MCGWSSVVKINISAFSWIKDEHCKMSYTAPNIPPAFFRVNPEGNKHTHKDTTVNVDVTSALPMRRRRRLRAVSDTIPIHRIVPSFRPLETSWCYFYGALSLSVSNRHRATNGRLQLRCSKQESGWFVLFFERCVEEEGRAGS